MNKQSEWNEYIDSLINNPMVIDDILLEIDGSSGTFPPIIKATLSLIEELYNAGTKKNIFVFPDLDNIIPLLIVSYIIRSMETGKIRKNYNPQNFIPGEIISYKGCRVQYLGEDIHRGRQCLLLKTSDVDKMIVPIELLPVFNHSNARSLSSTKKYDSVKEEVKAKHNEIAGIEAEQSKINNEFLFSLKQHRCHLSKTIGHVGQVTKLKQQIDNIRINDQRINELLYLCQIANDGELREIYSANIEGTPSIITSNSLYAIQQFDRSLYSLESLFIEIYQETDIEAQLPDLDTLSDSNIPINYFVKTADSTALHHLIKRGFLVWRWDGHNLTDTLCRSFSVPLESKLLNSKNIKVEHRKIDAQFLDRAFTLIRKHKNNIEKYPKEIFDLHCEITDLALLGTWQLAALNNIEIASIHSSIGLYRNTLEQRRKLISEEMYKDYLEILNNLSGHFSNDASVKFYALLKLLQSIRRARGRVCIITHKNLDGSLLKNQLEYALDRTIEHDIVLISDQEFIKSTSDHYKLCIVPNWHNWKIMTNILHSYNSESYILMLFPHETRWYRSYEKVWDQKTRSNSNQEKLKLLFRNRINSIHFDRKPLFEDTTIEVDESVEIDEFSNWAFAQQNKKIRRILEKRPGESLTNTVDAIPIFFDMGYFALFKESKELICVTDIIAGRSDKIEKKIPEKLVVGDYIVLRESSKDIIREIADIILEKSGQPDTRRKASKWIYPLNTYYERHGFENLTKQLRANNCTVTNQTVRNWINGETIIPREDEIISKIFKATLRTHDVEDIKEIINAGRVVQNAHVRAGFYLSSKLKSILPQEINTESGIIFDDAQTIIEIEIEDIGKVSILEVLNVGELISVEDTDTNRLISDELG